MAMALEGAHADEGYANIAGGPKDGPVLTMMSKRLRALKKKYNRILQIEENKRQGKTVNKEQEDVLKTKIAIAALIDEYEKLRQPLIAAVKEEVAEREKELLAATLEREEEVVEAKAEEEVVVAPEEEQQQVAVEEEVVVVVVVESEVEEEEKAPEEAVEENVVFSEGDVADLLKLLYFAHLFDVRSQGEAPALVWTRVHERSSCLSYDFVTDDTTTPLIEGDLDALSLFGSMLTSRPPNETLSHRDALQRCIEHAREWLQNSDRVIQLDSHISYSRLRERLNRILSSEYFTMTPELQTVSQQTAAAAASAAGQYLPTKDVEHIVPPAYYVPQEPLAPVPPPVYEFTVPGSNGGPPASAPLIFLTENPVPAFEMPQFGSHGSHDEANVGGTEETDTVQAATEQQQQPPQQPAEEVPVGDAQPQPPIPPNHHFPHHQQGPGGRSGYQQQQGAGGPARGGRSIPGGGGYQGMGGRNGSRGYINNGGRGGRGGRGGMYPPGGRGGQFYEQQQQPGGFQPRPNHYGGGGGRGGRGGRGGGMMYNGQQPSGAAAPPAPAAAAVAPTSG